MDYALSVDNFPDGAALIIGASGGIGSGVVRILAQDGAAVALGYHRKRDVVDQLAGVLPTKATTHHIDVTDPSTVDRAVADAIAAHGRIHTLVWAAGPLVEQHFLAEIPLDQWEHAFAVEVHGLMRCVRALLPHMRDAGGGSIVHLGSAGHLRWPDRDGLSVAPKAANESWLRGIAREEGRHNIRANSVLVGVIDAGMFHELMAKGAFPPGWTEETLKMLAIKRWGAAAEIGHAVSWLASSRAAYVTGQQINVSGGFGL